MQRIQELQAKQPTKPRGAVTILAFQATCGEDCTRGNKHDQSWNIANMFVTLDVLKLVTSIDGSTRVYANIYCISVTDEVSKLLTSTV